MQGARLGVTAAVSAGDRSMRHDEMMPARDLGGSIGRREVLVEETSPMRDEPVNPMVQKGVGVSFDSKSREPERLGRLT